MNVLHVFSHFILLLSHSAQDRQCCVCFTDQGSGDAKRLNNPSIQSMEFSRPGY